MKPKLTLRDLFWLVLVCALMCAWWLDRQRKDSERLEVIKAYSKMFKSLEVEFQRKDTEINHLRARIDWLEEEKINRGK